MSPDEMAAATLSRPKIHRLPNLKPAPKPAPVSHWKAFIDNKPLVVCVVLFALYFPVAHQINKAYAPAPVPSPVPVASLTPPKPLSGDYQGVISEAHASGLPEDPNKTIVLKGDNQVIVGRMAKIPAQSEQITEIKNISNVDNDAGRELLSIISKY